MRKAFEIVELIIVIGIITIISAIAIPNLLESERNNKNHVVIGKDAIWKGQVVTVIGTSSIDRVNSGYYYLIRIDNGADKTPRWSEINVNKEELKPLNESQH